VGSCGADDGPQTIPEVPSTVSISGLRSSTGAEWLRAGPEDPTPAELELPCDGRIIVSLELTNFSTRAPGACISTPQCGHVIVELASDLDPEAKTEAAAVSGPVLLELGTAPQRFVGNVTLTARLVRDDGSAYVGSSDPMPVNTSLPAVFRLAEGCPEPPL
jgi:hypothetical protein